MAKIRKGLSDADMLKGFNEELTFENGMYADEKVKQNKLKGNKAPAKMELLLPEDAQERLNRFLLEISMECLKKNQGSCTWKVSREGEQIIIKPVAVGKK
ncbi:MAG: hypothetical protein SO119_05410 [Phascolarctobacterium sp.]|nr:hypothetical protein [Phascolarctobacterium sp.]